MRLLYIADDGFSYHNGKYYCTRANIVNIKQFGRYFSEIAFLARDNKYIEGSVELPKESKVYLVKKLDFFSFQKVLVAKKNEYDVALLRNGLNGCLAANTLKRLNKIVISYLGYDALVYKFAKHTISGYLEGIAWCILEKNKMKKGDYAHYCADYLKTRYPSKVEGLVCPNVEIEVVDDNLKNRIKRYKDSSNCSRIGMIATLNYYKGIDTAIKSMSLLPSEFMLEIVGSGEKKQYEETARKYHVEDRVIFKGYYSNARDLNEWIRSIDIYIQPSLSEGLPRAAIEAMSMACPLIVSNTIGVSSWIDKEWHINPRDYETLAEKIKLMSSDKNILIHQAEENFEKAKMFSPEKRRKKMDEYYKRFKDYTREEA